MYELTKLVIRNFELLENRKIRSGPGEILCILMAELGGAKSANHHAPLS